MKILWINPSFLDYRIPLYQRLNIDTSSHFWILFSEKRNPLRVNKKVKEALGTNSIGLFNEKIFKIGGTGDSDEFSNRGIRIPFQKGLLTKVLSIDCDIIIAEGFFQWTPVAILKSILHKKKLLIFYERTNHTERNCPKWRFLYRSFVNKFVDGYIVNGILTKQHLMSTYKVDPDKIFTGGMCADSENLATRVRMVSDELKKEFRLQLQIPEKALLFIFIGQLIDRKGILELLKGWSEFEKKYSNSHLLIVGDGYKKQELLTFVSNFCDNVTFVQHIDYEKVHEYYAIADVLVMPTLEDNWSLVVPEGMATGLPIACSIYNGGYPELVKEGVNGTLFDPLDTKSVIGALEFFELNRTKLQDFGLASTKIEQNYSPQLTAQRILEACKSTIG